MSDFFDSFLAKYAPRLAGVLASFLVGEAHRRLGLTLDQAEVVTLMLAAYAAVHRLVSRYTNPGDATKTVLIDRQKAIVKGDPVAAVSASAPAAPPQVEWEHGVEDGVL